LRQFSTPKPDINRIVDRVLKEPERIPALIDGLNAKSAPVKFGAAKAVLLLSQRSPEQVYPWFDLFAGHLDSPNSVFRWNAMRTLAALAPADRERKIERILPKLLGAIPGPQMIAAANAIAAAADIALAKPALANRLAAAILQVRHARYDTDECRNIAIGHAIVALGRIFHLIGEKQQVVDFALSQLENTRSGTQRKAADFLKRSAKAAGQT
jgi:hypothetical protein